MPPSRAVCRLMARGVGFALKPGEVVGIVGANSGEACALARDALSLQVPGRGRIRLADLARDSVSRRDERPGLAGSFSQLEATVREKETAGVQAPGRQATVTIGDFIAGTCGRRFRAGGPAQADADADADADDDADAAGDGLDASIIDAARRAGVDESIGRLADGYATPLNSAAVEMPGDIRWRLSLARILCSGVTLIVLDQPDAGLDREGERALIQMLRACRDCGLSVIVSARRAAVLSAADRLLMMRDGDMVLLDAAATVVDRLKEVQDAEIGAGRPPRMPARSAVPSGPVGHRAGHRWTEREYA